MKRYINRACNGETETVDELEIKTREDRKEIKRLREEYQLSDPSAVYYLSQRSTKEWNK